MSSKKDVLSDTEWHDMNILIKSISDSIKSFYDSDKSKEVSNRDISLMAMQVLSLLCGISRGYTKEDMDRIWEKSNQISKKINASKKSDAASVSTQDFYKQARSSLKN